MFLLFEKKKQCSVYTFKSKSVLSLHACPLIVGSFLKRSNLVRIHWHTIIRPFASGLAQTRKFGIGGSCYESRLVGQMPAGLLRLCCSCVCALRGMLACWPAGLWALGIAWQMGSTALKAHVAADLIFPVVQGGEEDGGSGASRRRRRWCRGGRRGRRATRRNPRPVSAVHPVPSIQLRDWKFAVWRNCSEHEGFKNVNFVESAREAHPGEGRSVAPKHRIFSLPRNFILTCSWNQSWSRATCGGGVDSSNPDRGTALNTMFSRSTCFLQANRTVSGSHAKWKTPLTRESR